MSSQIMDMIITDDPKVIERALKAGYIKHPRSYIDGDINIVALAKMKEKGPGDPMFKVDDEVSC